VYRDTINCDPILQTIVAIICVLSSKNVPKPFLSAGAEPGTPLGEFSTLSQTPKCKESGPSHFSPLLRL